MNHAKVVILDQRQDRVQLLGRILQRAAPPSLEVLMVDSALRDVDPANLRNASLLAFGDSATETSALILHARKLRTEKLYWEPIHICTGSKQPVLQYEDQWALYFYALPPDVPSLVTGLVASRAMGLPRRQEILRAFVTSLADELNSLADRLNPSREIEPPRLRPTMAKVLNGLSATKEVAFQKLRDELSIALSRPAIERSGFKSLRLLVTKTENILRDGTERGPLLTQLHTLNNILRLVDETPDAPKVASSRALARTRILGEGAVNDLPDTLRQATEALCERVEPILQSIVSGVPPEHSGSEIAKAVCELSATALTQGISRVGSVVEGGIRRVIVIEDDDDWRRRLLAIVERIVAQSSLDVQQAAALDQAQLLLKQEQPALALVDLGLPVSKGGEILPDAGLSLVKQFTGSDKQGRSYQHRFVILTAAEDYAEAVREALAFGISPGSYLQKDPDTWESNLQAQLRLRLQTPAVRAPTIEVFKRTGRIARIEGLEIKLDYPEWCLLATLAESRRGMWNEPEKLAHVLYWNYSLNPEGRNPETDQLDPAERILLQLPHYASELRLKLTEGYMQARKEPLTGEILNFEPDAGYRLNADARVLDRVEEHFRVRRRPTVLVVEDNPEWAQNIMQGLTQRGFKTRLARWTDEAKNYLETEVPDMVSLDLELPATAHDWKQEKSDARNAIELLAYLRERWGNIPVTILTGIPWRDHVMLELLRQGVRIDDYLSKGQDKPIARLASSLARLWQETIVESRILDWNPSIPLYPISIDQKDHLLCKVSHYPITASGKGIDILKVLSATPNVFVSRSELIEELYGDPGELDEGPQDIDNALNQHVRRLRKTITEATAGTISGDEIICGDRGIYWLRGLVQ